MRKLSSILALIMLLSMLCAPFTAAEQQPVFMINEAEYDGYIMRGNAIVPDHGEYFARITFFTENNSIILIEKVQSNGDFVAYIATDYVAYSVIIVDHQDAFIPGTFEIYCWFTCTLIGEEVMIP